jgi:hypothetical protein
MTYPVQDHIHLDLVANIGGAPEKAPSATYTVADRSEGYETFADLSRSWTGRPFFSSMVDDTGVPVVFSNMRYILRVSQSQLEALTGILLSHVVLCDNHHPNDGSDHTAALQHMRFMEMRYMKHLDPMLKLHEVSILLVPEPLEYAI